MELNTFYQNCMYGQWRSGEKVSYSADGETLSLCVENDGRQARFECKMYLPAVADREKFNGKCPFFVCMHPIMPQDYALSQGYAVIVLSPYQIASDDCKHNGSFYELYPYGEKPEEQTGVLMAWAWGASKVLDAVEAGLGEEAGLDAKAAIVTGVSRWGKATAVCGAFEKRFALVAPTCSGAGGLALNGYQSEGKTYDLTGVGGPKEYTYGQNEPLSCLQSEGERGWFNDYFLSYPTYEDIPVEQDGLVRMAAGEDRLYFIIAACMGEDWVNAPAMWECYLKANEYYEKLGIPERLAVHFHKEGHAVLEEDLRLLIPYFNRMHFGWNDDVDFEFLKTSVFEKKEQNEIYKSDY